MGLPWITKPNNIYKLMETFVVAMANIVAAVARRGHLEKLLRLNTNVYAAAEKNNSPIARRIYRSQHYKFINVLSTNHKERPQTKS
jgi:hypothetical protein